MNYMETQQTQMTSQKKLLSLEFFNKVLLKLIKAIKSDYICICPNCIFGTNGELSQISIIDNVVTGIPDGIILELPYALVYELSKVITEETDIYNELLIRSKKYGRHAMIDNYNKIMSMIMSKNGIPDRYIENLKEDQKFVDIMGLKADQGASLYKLDENDVIYIYKALIPSNKNDKVSLNYYKMTDINIGEFIIDKKFCVMRRYICYMGLI